MGKPDISDEGSPAVHELLPVSASHTGKGQPISTEEDAEDPASLKPHSLAIDVPEGITRIENITRSWNWYALAGVYFT